MAETRSIINNFIQYCGQNNIEFTMDATSEGGTIIYDHFRDLNPIPFKYGIEKGTGRKMKVELLEVLRKCFEEECILSPMDSSLHSQLTLYRGPNDDKGQTTDRVMAVAMAVYWAYKRGETPEDDFIIDI